MDFLYNEGIMDKLEDFLRYSVLFLYYGELFSKKQKQYLELYLEENSSFTEIAEKYGVTRQAVFDNIKRDVYKRQEQHQLQLIRKLLLISQVVQWMIC